MVGVRARVAARYGERVYRCRFRHADGVGQRRIAQSEGWCPEQCTGTRTLQLDASAVADFEIGAGIHVRKRKYGYLHGVRVHAGVGIGNGHYVLCIGGHGERRVCCSVVIQSCDRGPGEGASIRRGRGSAECDGGVRARCGVRSCGCGRQGIHRNDDACRVRAACLIGERDGVGGRCRRRGDRIGDVRRAKVRCRCPREAPRSGSLQLCTSTRTERKIIASIHLRIAHRYAYRISGCTAAVLYGHYVVGRRERCGDRVRVRRIVQPCCGCPLEAAARRACGFAAEGSVPSQAHHDIGTCDGYRQGHDAHLQGGRRTETSLRIGSDHFNSGRSSSAPIHGDAVRPLTSHQRSSGHGPCESCPEDRGCGVHAACLSLAHRRWSGNVAGAVDPHHQHGVDHIQRTRWATVVRYAHAEEVRLILCLCAIRVPTEGTGHARLTLDRCNDRRRRREERTAEDGPARGQPERVRVRVLEGQVETELVAGLYAVTDRLDTDRDGRIVRWTDNGLQLQVAPCPSDQYSVPVFLHLNGDDIVPLNGGPVARQTSGPVNERVATCTERRCHAVTRQIVDHRNGVR